MVTLMLLTVNGLCFQRVLADFVSVELVFHARAIEYYSKCFENLANIDDEADLEVKIICFWNSKFAWKAEQEHSLKLPFTNR